MTDGIHRCAWLENTEEFGEEWAEYFPVARTISITRLPKDAPGPSIRVPEWILQLCRPPTAFAENGETTVLVRFCPFCGAALS